MIFNISFIESLLKSPINISENGTIYHLIMPIFDKLGWKLGMYNNIVFEESTQTNKRIDIRFKSENNSFLIEAKRIGVQLTDRDFEQLVNYLNLDGINIGILTNGIDYWIADNNKKGLNDKKIYSFSLKSFSNCDEIILEYFKYPLLNFENLKIELDFIRLSLKLKRLECKNLFAETDQIEIKTDNKIEILKSNILENFDNLNANNFSNYKKFYQAKVEMALEILQKYNQDIEKIFEKYSVIFYKEEPNLSSVYLYKFNIYLYTNTSSKNKDLRINQIRKYLVDVLTNANLI